MLPAILFFRRLTASASFVMFTCITAFAQQPATGFDPRFKKHIIQPDFISEGVALADINKDGKTDIVAGAYWFEAPGWGKHEIFTPRQYNPLTTFSNSFLDFTLDVDQDGWMDVIRISLPGEEAAWYQNPGKQDKHWKIYPLLTNAGNESPAFVDIDGNGRADLVCNDPIAKEMIWLQSPVKKGDTSWQRHVIAKGDIPAMNRYAHGLGWGDMNADGRKDIIVISGWWECPPDPTQPNWVFHAADLGKDCSQMHTLDVNGDGQPELITASAHDYGIWWHSKNTEGWQHHLIFNKVSETHALALADVNGDGQPDLVTGKRYFAHNGKDPGGMDPALLYWFEYKPGATPSWTPHLIDDNSGVGLQVLVQDINADGLADIIISNKKGLFCFEQKRL